MKRKMPYKRKAIDGGNKVFSGRTNPEQLRRMSDQDIVQTFAELVEWWQKSKQTEGNLNEFEATNREPQLPREPFEGLEELIRYNRERWQYEQRLQALTQQHTDRVKKFESQAELVRLLLPVERSVTYTYGGSNPDLRGSVYTITHEPGERDNPSRVVVESIG